MHQLGVAQREIVHQYPSVVYQTDNQHRIIWVTPSVKQVLGYEPADLLGTEDHLLFAEKPDAEAYAVFAEALAEGRVLYNEGLLRHADGTLVPCAASIRAVFSEEGIPIGAHVGFMTIQHARDTADLAGAAVDVLANAVGPDRLRDDSRDAIREFVGSARKAGGFLMLKSPRSDRDPVDAVKYPHTVDVQVNGKF